MLARRKISFVYGIIELKLTNVASNNVVVVGESPFAFGVVVVVVVVEGLSKEILGRRLAHVLMARMTRTNQAMEMMQSLHICRESPSISLADFDLVWGETGFLCLLDRHSYASI